MPLLKIGRGWNKNYRNGIQYDKLNRLTIIGILLN